MDKKHHLQVRTVIKKTDSKAEGNFKKAELKFMVGWNFLIQKTSSDPIQLQLKIRLPNNRIESKELSKNFLCFCVIWLNALESSFNRYDLPEEMKTDKGSAPFSWDCKEVCEKRTSK